MNEDVRVIIDCIRTIAGTSKNLFVGTVTAIDEDDRQCTIESVLDEEAIEYEGVNLSIERNDGLIEIPAIDSTVLCVILPGGEVYVLKCSDVQKVICVIDSSNKFEFDSTSFRFNGGALDGLPKVNPLVTKLNNLESNMNKLIAAVATMATAASGAPGTPVTNATLYAHFSGATFPIVPMTTTVKADLENTKVKQ